MCCNYAVPVRLAVVNSHHYGRVEVYHNGQWGTVCDDGWNRDNAAVVCRQLGFYSTAHIYTAGHGTGPIWLSRISCFGNESNLFECGQLSVATKNCTHSNDAAVSCSGNRRKLMSIIFNY